MANNDVKFSDFTGPEKVRMGFLIVRMAKRSLADDGSGRVLADLKKKADRIESRAARRKNGK
jgi:hypothetical protein